jgi:hypothetical protein
MRFKLALFDAGATLAIVVLVLTFFGTIVHKASKKEHHTKIEKFRGHDAPVEEIVEAVLKVLGQGDKDLTPESPEKLRGE